MQSKSSINYNEKGIPIKGITCVIPFFIIASVFSGNLEYNC